MPQIYKYKVRGDEIYVKGCFLGFRKWGPLRWIPYLTGSEPYIWLQVESRKHAIAQIAIEHVKPDGSIGAPEFQVTNVGLIWNGNVRLRQLTSGGFHLYLLSIQLENGVKYRENFLDTGKVLWGDSVVQSLVLFLGGSAAALLIERFIMWLLN